MPAEGRGAEEAGVEPTEDACAPSNGFEARAPHRERYSSTLILLDFCETHSGLCANSAIFAKKTPFVGSLPRWRFKQLGQPHHG